MTSNNRIAMGKFWHERFQDGTSKAKGRTPGVPKPVTPDHPYIQEYLATLPKEEPKKISKKKGA